MCRRTISRRPKAIRRSSRPSSDSSSTTRPSCWSRAFRSIPLAIRGEEEFRYQLRPKEFYLPYLGIAASARGQTPPSHGSLGYRSLESLALRARRARGVAEGGRRIQAGDPTLTDDARNALRKLAFDLPLGATAGGDERGASCRRALAAAPHVLVTLSDALFRRKRVSFSYHGAGGKRAADRTCEPYGLFFLNGHWYLVARDTDEGRTAQLSREPNDELAVQQKTPAKCRLRDSRSVLTPRAREIARGVGDRRRRRVRGHGGIHGQTGAAIAAAALGRADESSPSLRRFHVRRTDASRDGCSRSSVRRSRLRRSRCWRSTRSGGANTRALVCE